MLLNLGILHQSINEFLMRRRAESKMMMLVIVMLWLAHCAMCWLMDVQRNITHCVDAEILKLRTLKNMVSAVLMASSSSTRLANSSRSPSVDDVVEGCMSLSG